MSFTNLLQKVVQVDAVAVNKDKIKHTLDLFNPHLLKIDRIPTVIDLSKKYNGINIITSSSTSHLILLNEGNSETVCVKLEISYDFYNVHEVLSCILPNPPSSFETVGKIVHMNLKDEHLPYKYIIGKVIYDKTGCTVINKLGNIDNVYRNFEFEIIGDTWLDIDTLEEIDTNKQTQLLRKDKFYDISYDTNRSECRLTICVNTTSNNIYHLEKGDVNEEMVSHISNLLNEIKIKEITVDKLETVHSEGGLKFIVDIKNCYWCSKLQGERQRLLEELKEGDVFCDVFCGVGPMVLPAVKKGCTVVCNDLNPSAVDCLKKSLRKNKMDISNVEIYNLDAEIFLEKNIGRTVDHFFFNLPEHSLEYIKHLRAYKGRYKVHCYFFCSDKVNVINYIYQVTGELFKENQVVMVRKVSPSKSMYKLTYSNSLNDS